MNSILQVIGYAVQLIDTADSAININRLDRKKISLSKIDKILKVSLSMIVILFEVSSLALSCFAAM